MPKKITIHKEGRRLLAAIFLFLLVFNVSLEYLFSTNRAIQIFLIALSLLSISFIAYFFRHPRRLTFPDSENVISPADGKVVVIEEVEETEYFNDKRKQISIFMSPTNVHVNRYPISGTIKYMRYHPGKYLVAWHPKSSTKNERNTVVIEDEGGEVLVRQIAGAVARRIVHYQDVGDEVIQGKELGFIKFGSRVDVVLPIDANIEIELNQKVKGGETVLATLES